MRITRRQLRQICESYLAEEVSSGEEGSGEEQSGQGEEQQKGPKSGPISSGKYPQDMIKLIEKEMDAVGMTNQYARIALLSVLAKESGLKPKSEKPYNKTPVSRIKQIWPWMGKKYSDEELEDIKKSTSPSDGNKKPGLGLFDIVYGPERPGESAEKYGNTTPEDGSKYRGRGFNQITWKKTYEKYAQLSGIDIVGNPDKLNEPETAAKVAIAFLVNRLKSGPQEKGLNGTANPDFQSQEDANEMLARANAGWGKGGSALARAIASTTKASQNFTTA